jgi:hypothetical protein
MAPDAPTSGTVPGQIEQQVAKVPERLLDVVAEDPERPHVEQEMGETTVEEHRGEHRHEGLLLREHRRSGVDGAHLVADLDRRQGPAGEDLT